MSNGSAPSAAKRNHRQRQCELDRAPGRIRGPRLSVARRLESPGLDDLLAEEPLDCDIVMAPIMASNRSDPAGFTAWCTPEHIVISGPRDPDDPQQALEVKRARSVPPAVRFTIRPRSELCGSVIEAEGVQVQTGPHGTLLDQP